MKSLDRLRTRGRAFRYLLRLTLRAGRGRAILVLTPVGPLTGGFAYLAARHLLQAAGPHDTTGLVVGALVFGALLLVSMVFGRVVSEQRVLMGEVLGYEVDREAVTAAAAIPGIEHFERAEYFDNLEVIRTQRAAIVGSVLILGSLIDGSFGLLLSAAILAATDPVLLFLLVAGVPAMILNNRAQVMVDQATRVEAARSRRALHYFDVATNPVAGKEVRVFGLAQELQDRHRAEWQARDRVLWGVDLRTAAIRSAGTLCSGLAFLLALAIIIREVRSGGLGPGDVFLLLGIMTLVVGQLGGAASGLGPFGGALDVVQRLLWIVDAASEAEREQRTRASELPARFERGIRLENVSYSYPDGTGALHDITLDIPPGNVVAIVGDNGAGKTTLVKLLFGLYRPSAGRILLDGQDLEEINQDAWRARTSACFQDYAPFDLLARQVVGVGDLARIDDAEAVEIAVRRAAAGDVVESLPQQFETPLGPSLSGADLSGGEWQRLAVARAMMRDNPLLIALDEPTSAIDPLAEARLLDQYASASAQVGRSDGGVMVLVSHRFSTVRMAHRIAVLGDGRLLEYGTHEELMAAGGTYAELYTLQATSYR